MTSGNRRFYEERVRTNVVLHFGRGSGDLLLSPRSCVPLPGLSSIQTLLLPFSDVWSVQPLPRIPYRMTTRDVSVSTVSKTMKESFCNRRPCPFYRTFFSRPVRIVTSSPSVFEVPDPLTLPSSGFSRKTFRPLCSTKGPGNHLLGIDPRPTPTEQWNI